MSLPTSSLDGTADSHWLTPVMEMAARADWLWPAAAPGQLQLAAWPRIATCAPGRHAGCAAAARAFTAATLARWSVADRGDDIVMVVSELVTNAWRHAEPGRDCATRWQPVQLGLLQSWRALLCAVCDPSPALPVPRDPGELDGGGRGLQVIGALSDGWGALPAGPGKVVWAVFAIAAAPQRPAPVRPPLLP